MDDQSLLPAMIALGILFIANIYWAWKDHKQERERQARIDYLEAEHSAKVAWLKIRREKRSAEMAANASASSGGSD